MKPVFNPAAITVESLNQFRYVTDPLADNLIAKIISSGQEKQINNVLMTLVRNSSLQKGMFAAFGPDLSTLLDDYFETSGQLPDWADPGMIAKAQRVFELNGPTVFMLLNMSSLPMCYCCGNGAQVLYDTGRLMALGSDVDPLSRRLMETAQMIVNLLTPGGLDKKGQGVVTIQKVRLIHASIRYFLKRGQTGNPWNADKFGEPINQEDLAGTLMSFGPVILTGLKKLGVKLTNDDANAWMHCWNIAGHLLGIDEKFLPETYEQGFQLATQILAHQAQESLPGIALASSCNKFIDYIIPGNAFDGVPEYLMSYFLQDFSISSKKDLPACVGIKAQGDLKDKLVLQLTHFVTKLVSGAESHDSFVQKIIATFNKLLLQGIIYHYNGGKGVQFSIPPSLQANWGLTDQWTNYFTSPAVLRNRWAWQKSLEKISPTSN
ncbi:MAG TPA: oxygenase MpaB family protein [Cyclobacteriaceae bacterium]|nr:oxygenase MpaB family protein [Cyclobacteriaceae bacterium]